MFAIMIGYPLITIRTMLIAEKQWKGDTRYIIKYHMNI